MSFRDEEDLGPTLEETLPAGTEDLSSLSLFGYPGFRG